MGLREFRYRRPSLLDEREFGSAQPVRLRRTEWRGMAWHGMAYTGYSARNPAIVQDSHCWC
jgi:hypothetical protein